MYIAEIAPYHVRGKLVSLNQLTIVLGILGAQIANWLIADKVPCRFYYFAILDSWNGQMGWRWMFWATAFPAAAFFLLMFIIPESPRWLSLKGRREQALSVFRKIGGEEYAQAELASMAETSADEEKVTIKQLFRRPLSKVVIIGIVIAVFQQWCGTNVIFNYAQEIFQSAGYSLNDVLLIL